MEKLAAPTRLGYPAHPLHPHSASPAPRIGSAEVLSSENPALTKEAKPEKFQFPPEGGKGGAAPAAGETEAQEGVNSKQHLPNFIKSQGT